MNTSMNRPITRGCIAPMVGAVAVALLIVTGVMVGAGRADGLPSRTGCAGLWAHPHSRQAQDCRDQGWVIQQHLVINRNRNAWTDVPRCVNEDSSWCYWNARTMGNHRGDSFVHLGRKGRFYGLVSINGRRS